MCGYYALLGCIVLTYQAHGCRHNRPSQLRHLVQASNATADLESGTPQKAGMLASTLSAAPEFTASQAYSNIMPFGRCRALVLDSSYRPIDVVNWQRAICLDLFDKVHTHLAML